MDDDLTKAYEDRLWQTEGRLHMRQELDLYMWGPPLGFFTGACLVMLSSKVGDYFYFGPLAEGALFFILSIVLLFPLIAYLKSRAARIAEKYRL